jgi:hypothetical protein
MIHVDHSRLTLSVEWEKQAEQLARELRAKPKHEQSTFIETNRRKTWGADEVLEELRKIVGNKCWYSETPLEGADPNVDHFRPKGQVREVDTDLQNTKELSSGYWWLAFEPLNFRLSSMHANQRRVDMDTEGGKWDYFPVLGLRAAEGTPYLAIVENLLALDPCSASDVSLLWFDPDGKPSCSEWKRKPNDHDRLRVKITIWLYHLNKNEIEIKRGNHMRQIRTALKQADAQYVLWDRNSMTPNFQAKISFDQQIAEIKATLVDKAEFAGAKRCAARAAISQYEWIEEFGLV